MRQVSKALLGAAAAVIAAAVAMPAMGQEELYKGVPKIASFFLDEEGHARLRYTLGAETAEVVVADLACEGDRNPDVEVHVPQEIAFDWIGDNAAEPGPVPAELSLGIVQAQMMLTSLTYDAILGDWALGFTWQGIGNEGLRLLAGSTELGVVTSGFAIALSDAEGQSVSLAAFVEACMTM
jgi:hypothetical protein